MSNIKAMCMVMVVGMLGVLAACGGGGGGSSNTPSGPTLKSIAVTSASPSIAAGVTTQFTATGTYSDGTTSALTGTVTWTSASTATATINASGLATGVAAGTSAITAAQSGVTSAAVTLTVTAPVLLSIVIAPPAPHILINSGVTQFTAVGTYGNSTTAPITSGLTWSSATPATATIDASSGLASVATAANVGATTVVTASLGSVTSNALTLTVSPKEFAIVTNFTDATVSQYYVAGNGVLTAQTPATVPTTTATSPSTVWPYFVVVDPTASFAYVANYGQQGQSIAQYTINKTTGVLTANGANVVTGNGPNGLATATVAGAASSFLYAVNINEDVAPYTRTISEFQYGTSGMLSANTVAPFVAADTTTAPHPSSIAIASSAGGAYAYISDYTTPGQPSFVSQFSVGSNGVLSPLTTPTISSGEQPNAIVVGPNGFVYAVNNASGSVSQYSIGAGGELAALNPATVAASAGAEAIAFNPAGTFAYVTNCPEVNGVPVANGSVSEYSVATDGTLTLIGTQSGNVGLCPWFLTVDPSGQFLYVANRGVPEGPAAPYSTTVSEFSLGGDGSLSPLSVATVTTGNQPTGIVVFSE